MILFLSGFISAFTLSYMLNKQSSEVTSYAWVHFISDNIDAATVTDDCLRCNILITQFRDKFESKVTFYTTREYEDQLCLLLKKLHDKSNRLLEVKLGTMTVDQLLNSDTL